MRCINNNGINTCYNEYDKMHFYKLVLMLLSRIALGGCASLGHVLKPSKEKTTLRGLRTRAVPIGLTAQSDPGLVLLFMEEFSAFFQLKILSLTNAILAAPYTRRLLREVKCIRGCCCRSNFFAFISVTNLT